MSAESWPIQARAGGKSGSGGDGLEHGAKARDRAIGRVRESGSLAARAPSAAGPPPRHITPGNQILITGGNAHMIVSMRIAESRLTTQGQISVPAEVRKKLGVAPGGAISWEELDTGEIVVRRADKVSFEEVRARFAHLRPARPVSAAEMDAAVSRHLAAKHRRLMSKRRG